MHSDREHILLSEQVGVPYIIVFLNKCDMSEWKELQTEVNGSKESY